MTISKVVVRVKARSEHDEQVALFQWQRMMSKSYPALDWMHAIPNAAKRSKGVAAWMRAEGMTAGIFDVFLPWPANGYHGLYVEMKRKPNKLTDKQTAFGHEMARRGFYVVVCYTADDAIKVIREYVGIN